MYLHRYWYHTYIYNSCTYLTYKCLTLMVLLLPSIAFDTTVSATSERLAANFLVIVFAKRLVTKLYNNNCLSSDESA